MGGKRAENVKMVRLALRAVVASAHSSCGQSYVPSEWRARASARCLLPYAALPHGSTRHERARDGHRTDMMGEIDNLGSDGYVLYRSGAAPARSGPSG